MTTELRTAIFALSPTEKKLLIDELEEDLDGEPVKESAERPEWHRAILKERLAAHAANPEEGSTWEEVVAFIRATNGR